MVVKVHLMYVVAVLLTEDADNRSIDVMLLPSSILSVSVITDPSTSQIITIVMPEEALALQLNLATPLAEILVARGDFVITTMSSNDYNYKNNTHVVVTGRTSNIKPLIRPNLMVNGLVVTQSKYH